MAWDERATNLAKAVAQSKTIHTIILSAPMRRPNFFNSLLQTPSLRTLQFKEPFNQNRHAYLIGAINSDSRLKAVATYTMEDRASKDTVYVYGCTPIDFA
jgi:hypothetical protein